MTGSATLRYLPASGAPIADRTRELLETAWSFPGSKTSRRSRTPESLALLLALGLHVGATLVKPTAAQTVSRAQPVAWEMLVPIEREVEASPPPEPTAPSNERPSDAAPTHVADPSSPMTPGEATEAGPALDDAAANLVESEFGDAEFVLPSGSGTVLGRGSIARPGQGDGRLGSGLARSVSLTARDLSRPAIAPDLQPLVDSNFPVAARLARVEGSVTVSALIQPDGNPTDVRVVAVDPRGRGFGETCSRTVHQGPDWKPKLNRDGRPVPAKVVFTCKFSLPDQTASEFDAPTTGAGANRVWTEPAGG